VRPLGLVQLEGAGERFEDALRDAVEDSSLEADVVIDAHPGEQRDLLSTKAENATLVAVGGQAGLIRGDPRAPGRQEVAHLAPVVHAFDGTSRRPALGGTAVTWFERNSSAHRLLS
jgi:hypothetical protein